MAELRIRDQAVIVDDADVEWLSQLHWTPTTKIRFRTTLNGEDVMLHRLVAGAKPREIVDHINCNKLDNRRANLRICSAQDSIRNQRCRRSGKVPFKGVYRSAQGFRAVIYVSGKARRLGYHDTAEAAALAYDHAARELFGAFARFNFPLPGEQSALREDLSSSPLHSTSIADERPQDHA